MAIAIHLERSCCRTEVTLKSILTLTPVFKANIVRISILQLFDDNPQAENLDRLAAENVRQ